MSDTMELEVPEIEELEVESAPVIAPEAAAARLRLRGFLVRPHGIKWLVLQDGNPRRLTFSPEDLSLAARIAQQADDRLTIDQLAEQLYAYTGETPPGADVSKDPPSEWGYQSLLIRQIRRDGGTQARIGLHEATVIEYTELMRDHLWDFQSRQRPIVLFDGEAFWLADGFHRIEAAQRAGLSDYPVEVLRGSKRDAILRAAGANSQHGLRRTNADKRQAVELLLRDEEWRQWSDRKIADVCAVGNKFVGDVRRDLSVSGTQIPETRTVERNGATYQMTPRPTIADRTDATPIGTPNLLPSTPAPPFAAQFKAAQERASRLNLDLHMHEGGAFSFTQIGTDKPSGGAVDWRALCDLLDRKELAAKPNIPEIASEPVETDADRRRDRLLIRSQAASLGLGVIWEDDTVILHWPDEDIEQLMGMGYQDALYWLAGEGIQQAEQRRAERFEIAPPQDAPEPVSDRSAHLAKEARDAGRIERARSLIEHGEYAQARTVLDEVEVSIRAADQLRSTIPVGRQITLALTPSDCAALLKEANAFAASAHTKNMPAITQVLMVLIEAIKGEAPQLPTPNS